MGTPNYSIDVLEQLIAAGHDAVGVVTQPGKRAGRQLSMTHPPVKAWAIGKNIPVLQPIKLDSQEFLLQVSQIEPQIIVVAAYGKFLPRSILNLTKLGCINIHPSLLPKYRGPSPVVTAILDAKASTGVTIIQMDQNMDTGPILAQQETTIAKSDTTQSLTSRLFQLGSKLLVETLKALDEGTAIAVTQDDTQATYTRLLKKEDGRLDFQLTTMEIEARIRAFHPWPGSHTEWNGKILKLIEVEPLAPTQFLNLDHPNIPGHIFMTLINGVNTIAISTGDGYLAVNRLQVEGRQPMSGLEFLNGTKIQNQALS